MMLDLSPKRTYIDCSGDGHIMAHEIESNEPKDKNDDKEVSDSQKEKYHIK